ncbi:MAG TPA: hypothetical protein VNE39_02230 [Planctomycetota bacterium]|nr:hypothetical protein [Planctomycetota bacterium]
MRRLLILACCLAQGFASGGEEPFDYFANSWNVIGLKDYRSGTRVTPANELLVANKAKVTIRFGRDLKPLSREQTKTLLDGWLPIILLTARDGDVRYDFTMWATPLPSVKDWQKAFDWPTEGENLLNWIAVKASNTGAAQAEAKLKVDHRVPESFAWPLAPGQSAEAILTVPFVPLVPEVPSAGPAATKEAAELWLQRTAEFWRGLVLKAARITVPCKKATEALLAAHVCQLIANDHGELHGGEGFYDEFYIRDGAYQLMELEEAGLADAAARAVAVYLKKQRPDGRFESQSNQFDANGQAVWVLWQYAKITGDRDWLEKAYPQMRKATDWIKNARKQAPADSPFAGLLPAAPADGESLWDGKHHILGYDFWNLRALLCTADAARVLGRDAEFADLRDQAKDYRAVIDDAWGRTRLPHFPPSWEKAGTHWGNTETLWPTEIFERDDPRVTASLKHVREDFGGGFVEGTIQWLGRPGAIHPYMSAYTTMASLVRGEDEKVVEEFYWQLLHSTAAHAFPEGIYYKRRYAWSETIPHVTGAANYALMLRHMLLHERGDELHLLLAVPDWWLGEGKEIRVERAPTHFGPMSLTVAGKANGVELSLDPPKRNPPKRIVLHLPKSRPLLNKAEGVEVVARADQSKRWDFPTVVKLYQETKPQVKPIPGLVKLPLAEKLKPEQCLSLDLSKLANTDPFAAPFGVPNPGKFLFTGLRVGEQAIGGVPFQLIDPGKNQGKGLVVLHSPRAPANIPWPKQVEIPVKQQGKRLFFLGNVTGWQPDDEGAGDWGAVAEYVVHYADGQTQTVPLISGRTADDWASPPVATEAHCGLKGEPWHLNVLGVPLRPVAVEKIIFRDLGTPAAPLLAAVTLER